MPHTGPKSIVLVDDEKSYTDLMTQLLADNLARPVHGYTRPLDALRELPALDVAVVVTDYHMPQMDGIEFIRQAAPVVPGAVFVMITGHNLTAASERLEKLSQLRGFLPKPFGWRTLADEIRRVWPPDTGSPVPHADATAP